MSSGHVPYFMKDVFTRGKSGDGDACYDVAEFYYAQKDWENAFEWYKKAAACRNPNPNALFNLGYAYQYGEGTEVDMFAAFEAYQKAAEQDLPQAMMNLAYFYESGVVVPQDKEKADDLCRQATLVLNNLQTELYKTRRDYRNLESQSKDLKKQAESAKEESVKLDKRVKAALEDIKIFQDKLERTEREKQDLQKKCENTNKQLAEAKDQLGAVEHAKKMLSLLIDEKQQSLDKAEQDNKNLKNLFDQCSSQLTTAKREIEKAALTEAELRQALLALNRKEEALIARIRTGEEDYKMLDNENNINIRTIQKKVQEIDSLSRQVEQEKGKVASTTIEMAQLQTQWEKKYKLTIVLFIALLVIIVIVLMGNL